METVGRLLKTVVCMLTILVFERKVVQAENTQINIGWQLERSLYWYEQPWVWVAASCFFLLMLVLVLRRDHRKGGS